MKGSAFMFAVCMMLAACSDSSCDLYTDPPEEPVATPGFGIKTVAPVKKGWFFLKACLQTFEDPLTGATIKVTLPREVSLLKGELRWNGYMNAHSERCLDLELLSNTDWQEWSAPINSHAEFVFRGEKNIGDQNWSLEDYQKGTGTVWQTEN